MKLTDTQLVLLSAAAQRQDGAVELGPKLKGSASQKLIGKLLSEHLVEEIPAQGSLPMWRRDEDKGALALRITERGLDAIGADQLEHRRGRPAGAWGQGQVWPNSAPGHGPPQADRRGSAEARQRRPIRVRSRRR